MTTTVIIKSPKPNHLDVFVEILGPKDPDGVSELRQEIRLREGEEITQYVYQGQYLTITEIDKEPTKD